MAKLTIRFVTDYVCPYCIAAKVPLMQAVQGRDVEIQWMPLELTAPGKPQVDTYHDEVRKAKWAKELLPFCAAQGLDVHIPPHVVPRPYTHLAFMGYYYACEHGCGETYNTRMYQLYFAEEQDIGSMDVLKREAAALGMDPEDFEKALLSGMYEARLAEANRYAREELHVKSVPTVWIGDTQILDPLMSAEDYAQIIDVILEGLDAQQGGSFTGCGPDGC